jgi:hypothetical protein
VGKVDSRGKLGKRGRKGGPQGTTGVRKQSSVSGYKKDKETLSDFISGSNFMRHIPFFNHPTGRDPGT